MPYRTFTTAEAAEYLHISRQDIERLIKRNEIPFERLSAKGVVFRKRALDEWASQRILGFNAPRLAEYLKTSSAKEHDLSNKHAIVCELLRFECVEPCLKSRTKPSVLRDMVKLADRTGLAGDPTALVQSLEERERLYPTALPGGVALLHPRCHEPYRFADSFIVLGRTVNPVPFGAPDGGLTGVFFLICCQDDRIHLHVLARICMMCARAGLPDAIRSAADAEGIGDAVRAAESAVMAGL